MWYHISRDEKTGNLRLNVAVSWELEAETFSLRLPIH